MLNRPSYVLMLGATTFRPSSSIPTDWPLLLRIAPVFARRVDGVDDTLKDVFCPLTLNLGPDIEYELISRVIYSGSQAAGAVGHYTTQTRIGNKAYIYNDLLRDGALAELGPLYLLEEFNPNVAYIIYLRRSRSAITTRSKGDIQIDCAKIPAMPAPITIDDDDNEVQSMLVEDDDEISGLILATLGDPGTPSKSPAIEFGDPSPANSDSTSSTTPCPIFCHGCGDISAGDSLPDQVQCEKCRFWSHIDCLPDSVDWDSTDVEFICARCKPRESPNLFDINEIVMLPFPGNKNWRDDGVPARFISRAERSAGTVREYKFRWLDCNDWPGRDDALPLLIPQTYQQSREFCEAVTGVVLKSSQCYEQYFSNRQESARDTEAEHWLISLRLSPTPGLESLMQPPMQELIRRRVRGIPIAERKRHVFSIGSALLQLLAIQHQLGEQLNLNGDTMRDLLDGAIIPCRLDGSEALEAMFLATDPLELKHKRGWDLNRFSSHLLRFNSDHTIYDPSLSPPTFKRICPSSDVPLDPIVFDVPPSAVRPDAPIPPASEQAKRSNDGGLSEEPAAKRGKQGSNSEDKNLADGGGRTSKRSRRPKASTQQTGSRRSTRLTRP
ncbi:hypothetical protein DFH07DRAFT_781037 [Mycena maculata]|uniref:Zinc finger PHD-type domain-containing protein n=1 Tax=Mycena maculata TaxID=230809 RepID=A0AAD7MU45_9AGAR|nr:hypothetical protein DFH07DRAFT_781037 [Mycena maculata]